MGRYWKTKALYPAWEQRLKHLPRPIFTLTPIIFLFLIVLLWSHYTWPILRLYYFYSPNKTSTTLNIIHPRTSYLTRMIIKESWCLTYCSRKYTVLLHESKLTMAESYTMAFPNDGSINQNYKYSKIYSTKYNHIT